MLDVKTSMIVLGSFLVATCCALAQTSLPPDDHMKKIECDPPPESTQFCCSGKVHDVDETEHGIEIDASPVINTMLEIASVVVNAAEAHDKCKIPEKPESILTISIITKNDCCDGEVKRLFGGGSADLTLSVGITDCRIPVPIGAFKGVYLRASGNVALSAAGTVNEQTCTENTSGCLSGTISASGSGAIEYEPIPRLLSAQGGLNLNGTVNIEKCTGSETEGSGCVSCSFFVKISVFGEPLYNYDNLLYKKCKTGSE
jgi:hypothetical protein